LTCANYVVNRCPTVNGIVPHKLWYGSDFDYKKLKVFGSDAYQYVFRHSGDKMVDKSQKLKFVGYAPGGYRLLDPVKRKLHLSRDVRFNENFKPCQIDNDFSADSVSNVASSSNVTDVSGNVNNSTNICFLLNHFVERNPKNFSEISKRSDASFWFDAVRKERDALITNQT